jgi:ssDNA-binding Zn-finger/Zn-ribbon topoisomerase 1
MFVRLDAYCPRCRSSLELRTNRGDGSRFLGCAAYPRCRFTEPYEPRIQELARDLGRAHAHTTAIDTGDLDFLRRELLQIIKLAHPDRWHGHELATEVTQALNTLREKLGR